MARAFKLIKGRDDSTTFLPLNTNIGGQIALNNYAHKESIYLSEEQAGHAYKKVESGGTIDANALKQEVEQEQELSKLDDTSRDINLYRKLIVNNAKKVETI